MERGYSLILLMAGESRRMGFPKGLITIQGKPWLLHQLKQFENVGGREAVVVLGHSHERYLSQLPWLRPALDQWVFFEGLKIRVALNPEPKRGQFSSIQVGLSLLNTWSESVFISPIDVSLPDRPVWQSLARALERGVDCAIPTVGARGGHPVIISRKLGERLLQCSPGDRLDEVFRSLPADSVKRISVNDERVLGNANTPREWGLLQVPSGPSQ